MRLALMLLLATWWSAPSHAEDKPASTKAAELISRSAFCIAYVIRDADKRDLRPVPTGDPFQSKKEDIRGGGILGRGEGILDVAALASRATAQARVSPEQISRLSVAVLKTDHFYPIADCYEPHHAFAFYSEHGEPLCCIEICFTCKQIKTSPQLRVTTIEEELRAVMGADLIEIARIFDELKLPLTPYMSFEDLKKSLTKQAQESKARIAEDEKAEAAEKAGAKEKPQK